MGGVQTLIQRRKTPAGYEGGPLRTLIVVCAAVFGSVLNGSMVTVALPVIGEELLVEQARLGWIVTGYLLVFGVSVPFYGRLADKYGARWLFVLGMALFSVSSLLCALAWSFPVLMTARILQAIGSAAIPGLGMALISRAYGPEKRGSAMGFVSAMVGAGAAIGPTVGGFLSGSLGWQYLFVVSALAGLLIPFALRWLPHVRGEGREGFDLAGGVLLGLTVAGALLAATEGARVNLRTPIVLWSVAVACASALALVIRQRQARFPFIPRDLLHNSRFRALILISFSSMAVNLSTIIALPLLLTQVYGLRLELVGLVMLPEALMLAVLGPVAGRVVDRIGGRVPVRAGLVTMVVAELGFSTFGAGGPVLAVTALAGVLGLGFAFVNSPLTTMVSLTVPQSRLASGLSINSMFFFLGGGFGTALLSAVLTARDEAANAINPLHTGRAVAYSDTFLLLTLPLLAALLLSIALPHRARKTGGAQAAGGTQTALGMARK